MDIFHDEFYLNGLLQSYSPASGNTSLLLAESGINPILLKWANNCLVSIQRSGSLAKGTNIAGYSDLDLLISLSATTQGTLEEIYNSLYDYLRSSKYVPVKQNASIHIKINNIDVDLVPARLLPNSSTDHWIWLRRQDTWQKTNIAKQIAFIKITQRQKEIRLLKIWRNFHSIDFPSAYLEQIVIIALSGSRDTTLAGRYRTVLLFLRDQLVERLVVDVGNESNHISDDLTIDEKNKISSLAATCLSQSLRGTIA